VRPTSADFATAFAELPSQHRAWLGDGDIETWAYYGLGIILNDAQVEHLADVIRWPPGSIHVWRWANRTGKTTGLDVLYGWAAWYKWRFEAAEFDDWFGRRWKALHAAPLGELAGKAYELWAEIIAGTAEQQRDPINQRQRPALLAPFFRATKTIDANDVDRPVVECANGAAIDFRSTQGGAGRLESDQWWLLGWDEFPRQQPADDIPVLFDQTFLPRSSDFMAPIILAGTATAASEYIYAELEDYADASPADWNFTTAARSRNFAASQISIDRQTRLSINKDIANRSVGGELGGGGSSLYPAFLLSNAFDATLPEVMPPPADEAAWARFATRYAFFTSLDHALAHDDNVLITTAVPWPPHTITPDNPIVAAHIELIRSSRTLTGDEIHAYASREVRTYRSKALIIDATGEGGLSVYRKALQDGLPAVDCNLQGRAAKWVTNKEFGLQGLQRLFSFGLPVSATEGFIDEWPTPAGPFGLLRIPTTGTGWQKLRRQLGVMRRADEKLRQDAAMTLIQLAWYLWKLIGHAMAPRRQPFNIVAGQRRGRRRLLLARR
jgi:hypothetical protein